MVIKINKGQKFGKLVFIRKTDERIRRCVVNECMCDCGNLCKATSYQLLKGKKKSCGCLVKDKCRDVGKSTRKHGMNGTKFYQAFCNAKQRCNNERHKSYHNYGGRGIKMERKCFEEFNQDMYDSYIEHCKKYGKKETTLDRIDVNGNYCKENCRRATHKEQGTNTRTCIKTEWNGKIFKTRRELCEYLGVKYDIVCRRMSRGWSLEDAIKTARRKYPLHI